MLARRLFSLRHQAASHLMVPASSANKRRIKRSGNAPAIESTGGKWQI
jgi:hypothetical protein